MTIADGCYERTSPSEAGRKRKDRWLFTWPAHEWFAIAGLARDDPVAGEPFTLLTRPLGPDVSPYHSRQIVLLSPADALSWLDGAEPHRLVQLFGAIRKSPLAFALLIIESYPSFRQGGHRMAVAKRVLLVFGTRPEAIKMAPVYYELRARPDVFAPVCCVTGQHRGLLDQALASFGIAPDIDLNLMRDGQQPGEVGSAVLSGLQPVLHEIKPDLVLVHGDTTTTMASALAAFYAGIPVGHVEAGLRSNSLREPFPEELNRRVTSVIARYHFAPTQESRDNLLREGCDPSAVFVTGNTVVDALLRTAGRLDWDPALSAAVAHDLEQALAFDWRSDRFVLITCHRRESFGRGLTAICAAIAQLATLFPDVRFILPVHPNPAVRAAVAEHLNGQAGVRLTSPLRYEAFVALLRACHFVLTDSGGIQEEAPSFGKPVLVMRDITERPEAVAAGCARVVGTKTSGIVAAASKLLGDPKAYGEMVVPANPFGDGRAAQRIAEALANA